MKKRILSLTVTLCILLNVFGAFAITVSAADDLIQVYIDNQKISFDVEPEIINGRTMVPMRKIFEYLGAKVEWYQYEQSIDARCGYLRIKMRIDDNKMYVNDNCIMLDVPPIIKNERTLVPLRAVAEAFSSEVEWIGKTNTVKITTPYPKNQYTYNEAFDKYHIRTSTGDYEYFDFRINGEMLTITGCTQDDRIKNIGVKFGDGGLENVTSVTTNEIFKVSVDLSEQNISDEIDMNIYTKKQEDVSFWSYIYQCVYIEKNNGKYQFKKPLVWENNKSYMSEWINPIAYINPNVDAEIVNLSNDICKYAKDDYEKILLIHDWVADNIYYNYDYYYNRGFVDIQYEALGVYQSKRSVCEGYANLTQALINAQGIPCRKVSGYSLGLGSNLKYWTDESASTQVPNHAWNQAYVDNRWINIDTTWNSGNKYEGGAFLYKGIQKHLYFDITDVFFSYNHKYIK